MENNKGKLSPKIRPSISIILMILLAYTAICVFRRTSIIWKLFTIGTLTSLGDMFERGGLFSFTAGIISFALIVGWFAFSGKLLYIWGFTQYKRVPRSELYGYISVSPFALSVVALLIHTPTQTIGGTEVLVKVIAFGIYSFYSILIWIWAIALSFFVVLAVCVLVGGAFSVAVGRFMKYFRRTKIDMSHQICHARRLDK